MRQNNVQPLRNLEDIQKMKDALLRYCSYRDYFLFILGINTGLRVNDLLYLTVENLKGKTHFVLKEKKTGKLRNLYINPYLQKEISLYIKSMKSEELLFPSRKGNKPITATQAYRIIQKGAEMAGIQDAGTRTLRKTFGYHHYQRNKDIALLQEIFSHSSPSVTKRYIGITQDLVEKSLKEFYL